MAPTLEEGNPEPFMSPSRRPASLTQAVECDSNIDSPFTLGDTEEALTSRPPLLNTSTFNSTTPLKRCVPA